MKQYTLNLTVTDEANNEQFINLRTIHLPGPALYDLVLLTLSGIQSPEPPEIVVSPKTRPVRKRKIRNLLSKRPPQGFSKPPGFDPKDVE